MMRFPALTALAFIATQSAVAVKSDIFMADKVDDIAGPPTCGAACIKTTLIETRLCPPTNQTCICTNVRLNQAIQSCVTANCTVKDALLTKRYSTQACGIKGEDRTKLVWIIGVTFGAIGLAAFFLRCLARLGTHTWGLDDWFMCVAVAFMVPLCVISVPLSEQGLGLDMWNVSFEGINTILYLYYLDEMLYITSLGFTKISILCFYLKVFPARWFRNATHLLIGLNLLFFLSHALVVVFQCSPIEGAWRAWDGEYAARCLSVNVIGWSGAGGTIALDLATIVLPLPQLCRLSMASWRHKAQIVLMFAVGFFVTCVSVIRLRSLIEFGTTQNVTQDYVQVGYWSTIEVPVGITCACMPAIRSLFSLVLPKVFGAARSAKSSYALSSSGSAPPKNRPRGPGGTNSGGGGGSQIKVKQEWTVTLHGNDSDERLVGFDRPWQDESKVTKMTSRGF